MAVYNDLAVVDGILARHALAPSSFNVNLYSEHWTLGSSQSKFLYNNPVASLLDDIRAQRIPTDFVEIFETAGLKFYEGCLIVELLDYRPAKGREVPSETPEMSRVLLRPTTESLAADLARIARNAELWSDVEVLELEAKILLHTAPPLCLDPDPQLGRLAATAQQIGSKPVPGALKRKSADIEEAEAEREVNRKHKVVQFMNPRQHRSVVPSNRITSLLEKKQTRPATPPMVKLTLPGSTVHALPTHYPNVAPVNSVSNMSAPPVANPSFPLRPPPRAAQPSPAPIQRAPSTLSMGRASPVHHLNGNLAAPLSRPPSTQQLSTPILSPAPAPMAIPVDGSGTKFALPTPMGFLKSLPPTRNVSTPAPSKTPSVEAGRPQVVPQANGPASMSLPVVPANVPFAHLAQIKDPRQMLHLMQQRPAPDGIIAPEIRQQIFDTYHTWLRSLAHARGQVNGHPQGLAPPPTQSTSAVAPTLAPSHQPPQSRYPTSTQGSALAHTSNHPPSTHTTSVASAPASGQLTPAVTVASSFNSPIKVASPMPPHTQPMPTRPTPPVDVSSSPMPRAIPMPRAVNSPRTNPNSVTNLAPTPAPPGSGGTASGAPKSAAEAQHLVARQAFQKMVTQNSKVMDQVRLFATQNATKDGLSQPTPQHLNAAMAFMFNRWYNQQLEAKRAAAASTSQSQPPQPISHSALQVPPQLHPTQIHPQTTQQGQPVHVIQPQPHLPPQPQPPQAQPLYRPTNQHPTLVHAFQQQVPQQGFPAQQLQPTQLNPQQGFNSSSLTQQQAQLRTLAGQSTVQMQQHYLWMMQQQQQQLQQRQQAQQQAGVGRGAPQQTGQQPYPAHYMAARGQMPQQPPGGR